MDVVSESMGQPLTDYAKQINVSKKFLTKKETLLTNEKTMSNLTFAAIKPNKYFHSSSFFQPIRKIAQQKTATMVFV